MLQLQLRELHGAHSFWASGYSTSKAKKVLIGAGWGGRSRSKTGDAIRKMKAVP